MKTCLTNASSAAFGRRSDETGKIVRVSGVRGGRPVFAGTRIPTGAIKTYLKEGYDTAAIIREYPALTAADIAAAKRFFGWDK